MTPTPAYLTALPGFITFALLVSALLAVIRRTPRLNSISPLWPTALFCAFLIRILWIPAWSDHQYDGHEAEYGDLFSGIREPSRGGPVLYPTMQWFWWLLGGLLPADPRIPVLFSALFGTASVGLLARAWSLLAARPAAPYLLAFFALHPSHAAWSSSAYNIILPFFFLSLAIWATARWLTTREPSPAEPLLAAAAAALLVATRLDAAPALGLLPLLVWAWPHRPPLRHLLLPSILALILGAAAAAPILFPGELPGEGERLRSLRDQFFWFAPYRPLDSFIFFAGLPLVVLAFRANVRLTLSGLLIALLHHTILATFDDFADRHALFVLPALSLPLALAFRPVPHRANSLAPLPTIALLALLVHGLQNQRQRYYAPDERWQAQITAPPWRDLPRWSLTTVSQDRAQGCPWVVEDHRLASDPPLSHFNLLDPVEVSNLRGPQGCLRWCLDAGDWRWSSRGIRDRSLRIAHLYRLEALALVEDPASGYLCLAVNLGPRRDSFLEPRGKIQHPSGVSLSFP